MHISAFKKWFLLLLTMAGFLMMASRVQAQEAPDALVKRVSQEVMSAAKTDKAIQAGNSKKIRALVETKIFPHVDFERMTALAAGRYWRSATEAQRQQLTKEFRDLLVQTYASAIAHVADYKLQMRPLRADPSATDVIVQSRMIALKKGTDPQIDLGYRLRKEGNSWKIYDMHIMGAWLVETYKSTFATEISRSGIDGLIKTLAEKNRNLAKSKK